MAECVLCKVDAIEADEGTRRALHFVIGQAAGGSEDGTVADSICEEHLSKAAFALVTLAQVTGHAEYAPRIRAALSLRLVPSEPESAE